MRAALAGLLLALLAAPVALAQDAERLRTAKALFFDRKYAEARAAWTALQAAGGPEADAAGYWIARCSESLGEHERALREYGEYLKRRAPDPALAEEARTGRIGLATRLYKQGRTEHLRLLTEALQDPSRTVRYFAALQLSTLGPQAGRPAVPVLRRILSEESDEDLVERAKLGLLRLDPKALAEAGPRPLASGPELSWIRVRMYEKGKARPALSVNLPFALAELVFKSLPDEARRELRRKGYDADNFWERLRRLGRTEILEIVGEDGERLQIWIE